jgi:hypothetical protein
VHRGYPAFGRELPQTNSSSRTKAAIWFGRLKHEWALSPLRVRGLERVEIHADLTILAKLSCVLARATAIPLAA